MNIIGEVRVGGGREAGIRVCWIRAGVGYVRRSADWRSRGVEGEWSSELRRIGPQDCTIVRSFISQISLELLDLDSKR